MFTLVVLLNACLKSVELWGSWKKTPPPELDIYFLKRRLNGIWISVGVPWSKINEEFKNGVHIGHPNECMLKICRIMSKLKKIVPAWSWDVFFEATFQRNLNFGQRDLIKNQRRIQKLCLFCSSCGMWARNNVTMKTPKILENFNDAISLFQSCSLRFKKRMGTRKMFQMDCEDRKCASNCMGEETETWWKNWKISQISHLLRSKIRHQYTLQVHVWCCKLYLDYQMWFGALKKRLRCCGVVDDVRGASTASNLDHRWSSVARYFTKQIHLTNWKWSLLINQHHETIWKILKHLFTSKIGLQVRSLQFAKIKVLDERSVYHPDTFHKNFDITSCRYHGLKSIFTTFEKISSLL